MSTISVNKAEKTSSDPEYTLSTNTKGEGASYTMRVYCFRGRFPPFLVSPTSFSFFPFIILEKGRVLAFRYTERECPPCYLLAPLSRAFLR